MPYNKGTANVNSFRDLFFSKENIPNLVIYFMGKEGSSSHKESKILVARALLNNVRVLCICPHVKEVVYPQVYLFSKEE
jgi:hypothetical protein